MKETSQKMFWAGRILSAFLVLFLFMDGIVHVMNIPPVAAASHVLGLPNSMSFPIGVIELVCLALYVYPRTAILGAVLLTGYLGGAVCANLRAQMPLFSNTLFPVYTGILVWGGLFLRDKKVREILPFKK